MSPEIEKKRQEKQKFKKKYQKINVPAYDGNWPFCFNVPCKGYQS